MNSLAILLSVNLSILSLRHANEYNDFWILILYSDQSALLANSHAYSYNTTTDKYTNEHMYKYM